MKKLFIACDHAAYESKEAVRLWLKEVAKDYELVDLGTNSPERCDYPVYASSLAKEVSKGHGIGVLLCGSGIGASMVANRYARVRAALCRSTEDAKLSREHNDSNVICLGARFSSVEELKEMITTWLNTNFEGGRHLDRVKLFSDLGENA